MAKVSRGNVRVCGWDCVAAILDSEQAALLSVVWCIRGALWVRCILKDVLQLVQEVGSLIDVWEVRNGREVELGKRGCRLIGNIFDDRR